MKTESKSVIHIVWTTIGDWTEYDTRGNWGWLGEIYKRVEASNIEIEIEYSHTLPNKWLNIPQKDFLSLNIEEQSVTTQNIQRLIQSDRIASGLTLIQLFAEANAVHLVCQREKSQLNQRIWRLKSRTATLLNFETKGLVGGVGTWTKGFWYAELFDQNAAELLGKYLPQRTKR